MIESLKKTMLAGLGAAVVTRDKIVDSLDDLVKQGKISTSDARDAAEKIAGEARRDFDKASTKLSEKFRDLVSYADGEHARRLEELEARVAAMEAKHTKGAKPRAKA